MASLSESAAHFTERMLCFGVPTDLLEKLKAKMFVNFVQSHCVSACKADRPALRRAYAEAKATVVFDMRQRFDKL
eukprot:3296122-Amphidinium_carterae.1